MSAGADGRTSPGADGFDVAIVGAGVVGLGAAYAAVRRGLRVVVIERGARPTGATIRNFGHLCIGAQEGVARRHADASREIWLGLASDAGFWLRESGTLIAARHPDELALIEAAAGSGGIRLLDAAEFSGRAPVGPSAVIGGGLIEPDLQVNPREAGERIAAHLASLGVEFRPRTAVTAVRGAAESGVGSPRVLTSRGPLDAGLVVVAVNHDIDQLWPELAEEAAIERCALDMLRVRAGLMGPLDAPLLTGWSLIRYGRFAGLPEAVPVRERLHAARPDLAAIDLNQMYTQLPDGTLLVGDTHQRDAAPSPFQAEAAQRALLDEARALFGIDEPRVIERWQGVYASGREDFLDRAIAPGVHAIAATTGIGMTCGLGLAEHAVAAALDLEPARSRNS